MNLLDDPGQTEWIINIPQNLHCKEINGCYVVRIGLLAVYKMLLLVREGAEQSTGDWPNWTTGSIAFFA